MKVIVEIFPNENECWAGERNSGKIKICFNLVRPLKYVSPGNRRCTDFNARPLPLIATNNHYNGNDGDGDDNNNGNIAALTNLLCIFDESFVICFAFYKCVNTLCVRYRFISGNQHAAVFNEDL